MAMQGLKRLARNKCFGGFVEKWQHDSTVLGLPAKFSVFLPEKASEDNKVNALYWLSGLTCTEDNFIQKAGAQSHANKHNVALICPDTSPRGANQPTEDDAYDFGTGAGFYVDATKEGWNKHYNMYSYITDELPKLIEENFHVTNKKSIFGHSMGGHGALSLFLKNPDKYQAVSAFAPIVNPLECPWGQKAFNGYFNDPSEGKEYDSTVLVTNYDGEKTANILIDQGTDDDFYKQKQLLPENFKAAVESDAVKQRGNVNLELNMREGYDHSYFFISTFVGDHIAWHAKFLN